MDIDADVNLFLAVRPYYEPSHVREIEVRAIRAGTPFCRECADWHSSEDEHSLTD